MKKYKIVAITNCPAGIAHTYMVAEAFESERGNWDMRFTWRPKEPVG